MEKEFEKEIERKGYHFEKTNNGFYALKPRNRIQRYFFIRLFISKPVDSNYHGSQNGNELDGIGLFHFTIKTKTIPDYFTFVFQHTRLKTPQFMTIPSEELKRRLRKNKIQYRNSENLEIKLWLMDNHLYDCANLGLEGEYYYLTKGRDGRMIDQTEWNYTKYLNNWPQLLT